MSKIKSYFTETYNEMFHKVTWPTWEELQINTIRVVVSSILISLIIFLLDFLFCISGEESSSWKGLLGFIYSYF